MLLLCAGLAALRLAGSPTPSRYEVMLNDPWPTGCAVRSGSAATLPFCHPWLSRSGTSTPSATPWAGGGASVLPSKEFVFSLSFVMLKPNSLDPPPPTKVSKLQ